MNNPRLTRAAIAKTGMLIRYPKGIEEQVIGE